MTLKTLTTTLFLAASFLLFTACEGIGGTETNTTTPAVTLASLKLTIAKTSLNKDENTTVKVMASYSDNISKDVTEAVEWIVTPEESVSISDNTLTAQRDIQTSIQAKLGSILSEKVNLNITWIVNGHVLPPEPDPQVNNSTLLGIDVNNNDVRDDVERKIYTTFKKEIKRQYFMQEARHLQAMLADPELVENAMMWANKDNYVIACGSYIYMQYDIPIRKGYYKFIKEAALNTKGRVRKYLMYDHELSGGVYSVPNELRVESSCDFNVTKAL